MLILSIAMLSHPYIHVVNYCHPVYMQHHYLSGCLPLAHEMSHPRFSQISETAAAAPPVRRSRHLSINEPSEASGGGSGGSSGSRSRNSSSGSGARLGYVKVKSQWQRAVRRLSSPNPTDQPTSLGAPSSVEPVTKTAMEKPGWGLRNLSRTRHLSIGPQPDDVHRHPAVQHQHSLPVSSAVPTPSLMTSQPLKTNDSRSQNMEVDSVSSESKAAYSSAYAYSLGKGTTQFPCGSETIMINSTLAHEAFRGEKEVSALCEVGFLGGQES